MAEPPGDMAGLSLPAISQGDIGQSGPIELIAASSSASWVALCEGEPAIAKLVLGAGAGEVIDSFEAADESGRYVIVTRAGTTQLIDAVSGARTDLSALGADLRRERADYAPHRALSFDRAGRQLAYLRGRAKQELVVRDLEGAGERTFPVGAGEIFRLQHSADGRYIELYALRDDTNGNGKLDWPVPVEATPRPCRAKPVPQFRSFGHQGRGDTPTRAVLDLKSGKLRDVPDLVTTLGSSLLVRAADGSLQLDVEGKRQALVPTSCAARVVFADADRGSVLATCQPPKKKKGKSAPPPSGKAELWLFAPGLAKNLQVELYETAVDRAATTGSRLVAVYPGSASALLDLERRELLPLPAGSRVLTTVGTRALVWRNHDLYLFDVTSRAEEPLARGVSKSPELLRAGSTVLLTPFVVLGAAGPALQAPLGALAVSVSGHALVPASNEAATGQATSDALRGPLHWVDARLPPPDGPPH